MLLATSLAAPLASAQSKAPPELQGLRAAFKATGEKNHYRLMTGDIDGYVDAVKSEVKADDWVSQLAAGDLLYATSPAAAIPFHEAVVKLAPNEGIGHLEIAFDYQRTGQCERAIPAWQAADRLGALGSPTVAIAAYCFFRTGRIDEGLALWSRVQWPAHRIPLDSVLSEMAMGNQALETHVGSYVRARGGDEQAFKTLLGNALDWRSSLWNRGINNQAFDAARDLAKKLRPADARLHRELDCANEASAVKEKAVLLDVLSRCRMLIDDGELPASSEVGKFLLARLDALNAASVPELLARHGPALDARARSAQGDLAALEMLAFLQVKARDRNALAQSDELGWRRYRVGKFAMSRVIGLLADPQERSRAEPLLKEALNDFPLEARLHKVRYEMFPAPLAERERLLVDWLVAEYAGLSEFISQGIVGRSTSTTLASVVYTLQRRRAEQARPAQ